MHALEHKGDTVAVHLSYSCLQVQQGHSHDDHRYHIRNQEHSSSVFVDEVWKPPKGTKAYSESHNAEYVLPVTAVDIRIAVIVSDLRCLRGLDLQQLHPRTPTLTNH